MNLRDDTSAFPASKRLANRPRILPCAYSGEVGHPFRSDVGRARRASRRGKDIMTEVAHLGQEKSGDRIISSLSSRLHHFVSVISFVGSDSGNWATAPVMWATTGTAAPPVRRGLFSVRAVHGWSAYIVGVTRSVTPTIHPSVSGYPGAGRGWPVQWTPASELHHW